MSVRNAGKSSALGETYTAGHDLDDLNTSNTNSNKCDTVAIKRATSKMGSWEPIDAGEAYMGSEDREGIGAAGVGGEGVSCPLKLM